MGLNNTTYWDVFNGDADGICALLQLRLAEPRNSKLVTGIKRDIALLDRVEAQPDDQVTVLGPSETMPSLGEPLPIQESLE